MHDVPDGAEGTDDDRPPAESGGFLVASCVMSLALAAVVLWDVSDLPPPMFGPIGSGDLPAAVAWILVGLAFAVLAARHLRRRREGAARERGAMPGHRPASGRTAAVLALTAAYALAVSWGGADFGLLSASYLAITISYLARPRGVRLLMALALSAAIGFGSDYLFTNVLFIDLP